MSNERPIFVTSAMKNARPGKYEVVSMKHAVIERDGRDAPCYWCKQPFPKHPSGNPDFFYATLEHIVPLADGGRHELSNCALACRKCNEKNIPKAVRIQAEAAQLERELWKRSKQLAVSRAKKGEFKKSRNPPPKPVIRCSWVGRYLRSLHKSKGLPPPTKEQINAMKRAQPHYGEHKK